MIPGQNKAAPHIAWLCHHCSQSLCCSQPTQISLSWWVFFLPFYHDYSSPTGIAALTKANHRIDCHSGKKSLAVAHRWCQYLLPIETMTRHYGTSKQTLTSLCQECLLWFSCLLGSAVVLHFLCPHPAATFQNGLWKTGISATPAHWSSISLQNSVDSLVEMELKPCSDDKGLFFIFKQLVLN